MFYILLQEPTPYSSNLPMKRVSKPSEILQSPFVIVEIRLTTIAIKPEH